jgi:hypothetical protein
MDIVHVSLKVVKIGSRFCNQFYLDIRHSGTKEENIKTIKTIRLQRCVEGRLRSMNWEGHAR